MHLEGVGAATVIHSSLCGCYRGNGSVSTNHAPGGRLDGAALVAVPRNLTTRTDTWNCVVPGGRAFCRHQETLPEEERSSPAGLPLISYVFDRGLPGSSRTEACSFGGDLLAKRGACRSTDAGLAQLVEQPPCKR
jgi:hypothetical protein